MSLAHGWNNLQSGDIFRQNNSNNSYQKNILVNTANLFSKSCTIDIIQVIKKKSIDRLTSQYIFEYNLKHFNKILCLPDPKLPRQLFLPFPRNFSPKLYLSCSKVQTHLLLQKPNRFNQKRYKQQIILHISFKLIGNLSNYNIILLIGHERNIIKIFLKLYLFKEFCKNPYYFYDIIKERKRNQRFIFFNDNKIPINGSGLLYKNKNIKTNLESLKKSISEILTENFRLSFKIQPPATGRKRWILSLFLQSREDPSLLIPIEHLLKKEKEKEKRNQNDIKQTISGFNYDIPSSIDRNYVNPYIEKDLKILSKIFQPFGQFERNLDKVKVYLSIEQTYTFLKEIIPKLQDQSYGVLVPDWWGKQDSQLGIKIEVKKDEIRDVNLSLLGANTQLEYNWEVSIGKNEISLKEFLYYVSLKEPLVKWNDKWIEMESKEIEYLLDFIKLNKNGNKKNKRNKISLKQSLELTIGKNRLKEGVRVIEVKSGKELKKIFDQFKQPKQITPIITPKTFHGNLRSYQQKGLSWMIFMRHFQYGVCLADDMGLGKTIQILAFLLHQQENFRNLIQNCRLQGKKRKINHLKPSLVVCPLSLIKNWVSEVEKFAPSLEVYIHHGNIRVGGKTFLMKIKKSNMIITTYQQVKKDKHLLSKVFWENIILDEAQNIKNYNTQQTKAIKSLKGNFRICLTGTPIENRLRELWSIMDFLNPGFLGTLHSFHAKYCIPIEKRNDQNCLAELKQILNPFILRRLKSEKEIISDLPNKQEKKMFVNLTLEQATLYQSIVNNLERELKYSIGISRSGIVLSTLLKLKQICNHPSQFLHEKNPWNLEDENAAQFYQAKFQNRSGKLNKITSMLKLIVDKGEKAVIFTQFTHMGNFLQSYLSKTFQIEVLYLNGSTSYDTRDLMVRKFQQSTKKSVIFILSLKAGGVGLNLTAANHAFHYDRWWNPAVEDQASDRIYRIGQKRDVTIIKFISVGTIEEKIDLMIEKKKKLSKDILNCGMSWISNMSTDELKKFLVLGNNSNLLAVDTN